MKISMRLGSLTILILWVLISGMGLPAKAQDRVIPIPTQEDLCLLGDKHACAAVRPVPFFIGDEAEAKPITAPSIPQNPYMADGAWSNFHNDTYMSDTYFTSGPLGHSPIVSSTFLGTDIGLPSFVSFDRDGRLVAAFHKTDPTAGQRWTQITLMDPDTLAPLAALSLPPGPVSSPWDFGAGGYAYVDNKDRIVSATPANTIMVVSHTYTPPFLFTVEHTYGLTEVIRDEDEIQGLQPDFTGRVWFTTTGGLVGTLDMNAENGEGKVLGSILLPAGEEIENGMAADETGGMYLASSQAMYRLDADLDGKPSITWREPYDAGTHVKVLSRGSGTTPTLMGKDFVTIADNADPQIHVLVYRRAKQLQEGQRLVCAVPVFKPGQSACENSLIATDKSVIAENNFGYTSFNRVENGSTTKPGITRIDIDEDGNGCHTVWTNIEETVASAATQKLSLANGLIYAYTKDKGPANTDAWYFTAIDFRTGEIVYKVLGGTGMLYRDHLSVLNLGPNGHIYVGVWGGIVSMGDGQ